MMMKMTKLRMAMATVRTSILNRSKQRRTTQMMLMKTLSLNTALLLTVMQTRQTMSVALRFDNTMCVPPG